MSFYSTTNNQTTRQIYNIIDDLEEKLSNRKKLRKGINAQNSTFSNYNQEMLDNNINSYYQRPQINSFINERYIPPVSTNQSQVIPSNLTMNQSSDIDVRKIIKEEFNSLMSPYQTDIKNNMNMLENKINNMSNDFKNENNKLRSAPNSNISKENILKEVKN